MFRRKLHSLQPLIATTIKHSISSMSRLLLLFHGFFLFFFFTCCVSSIRAANGTSRYTAMFSFGDSLTDTGNFLLSDPTRFSGIANPPYGMTYFGYPTGRCSDGRLIVDFMAEAFGLPLLSPYMKPKQSFRQGANFAFAGGTALDLDFFKERELDGIMWSNNSLSIQLDWFRKLKPSLCQTPASCKELFGKSLFLVGEIGANDYNYAFFALKTTKEVRSYVPLVVDKIISTTESLIKEGAVELIVPGTVPIGCSAMYLTMFGGGRKEDYDDKNGCLKRYNNFSKYHNVVLKSELQKLRNKYPQVKIIYADFYGATIRFAHAPHQHGFNGGLGVCCGGGGGPYNFDFFAMCGRPNSTVCSRPQSYTNWDGIHLTEAAYRSIATVILDGSFAQPPLNF